jgi:hypothetical protein
MVLIDDHGIAQIPEVRDFVRQNYRKAGRIHAQSSGFVYRYFVHRFPGVPSRCDR